MSEFKSQFENKPALPFKEIPDFRLWHCPYCGSVIPVNGNTQHATWCVQNALTTQWPLDDQSKVNVTIGKAGRGEK